MSRSNRLSYFASLIALVCCLLIAVGSHPAVAHSECDEIDCNIDAYPERYAAGPDYPPSLEAAKNQKPNPAKYKDPCKEPTTANEADLCQQWRMAQGTDKLVTWAEHQFWVTVAEIGFLFAVIATAFWAALEARRAVRIAERHLVTAERPWIRAKVSDVTVHCRDYAGVECIFEIEFENIGKSPAQRARARAYSLTEPNPRVPSDKRHAVLREEFRAEREEHGVFLFPRNNSHTSLSSEISKETVEKMGGAVGSATSLVCIAYDSPVTGRTHITSFTIDVRPTKGRFNINVKHTKFIRSKLKLMREAAHEYAD